MRYVIEYKTRKLECSTNVKYESVCRKKSKFENVFLNNEETVLYLNN